MSKPAGWTTTEWDSHVAFTRKVQALGPNPNYKDVNKLIIERYRESLTACGSVFPTGKEHP